MTLVEVVYPGGRPKRAFLFSPTNRMVTVDPKTELLELELLIN